MTDEAVPPPTWPPSWVGEWRAEDGKTVRLAHRDGVVVVTVAPGPSSPPCVSAELLGGGTRRIEGVPASCLIDGLRRHALEIEAGTTGLGPTYRLAATISCDGALVPAPSSVAVAALVLVPEVGMGLYDDYDDDLGVPWAYPLLPLHCVR